MKTLLSRKLLAAVGAGVIAFVASYWPEQEDLANQVVVLAIAYIAGQSVVDTAEHVAKSKEQPK